MDIATIINAIDAEISTRSSDRFGIKVGGELYKELAKAGKIKKATFAHATGAFPEERFAYAALLQNSAGKGFTFGIHAVRRAA